MLRKPFGPSIRAAVPAELASEAALLAHLGMTVGELNKIRWYRGRMYQSFEIAKSGGKSRLVSAPDKRLKHIQRQLLPLLYQLYQIRNPVHGFVFDRSVKTNAQSHLRRRFVLNLDLQDFFPTITENRVVGLLKAIGIASPVAVDIGYLCCIHGHLPQGAPTSPVLSNMICFRLDKELLALREGRALHLHTLRRRHNVLQSPADERAVRRIASAGWTLCSRSPRPGLDGDRRRKRLHDQSNESSLCRSPLPPDGDRPQG